MRRTPSNLTVADLVDGGRALRATLPPPLLLVFVKYICGLFGRVGVRRCWIWCFRLIWTALIIVRSFVAGHIPVNLSQDIIYMRMTYPDHLPHG